jgi:hypothetical protein
MLDIEDTHRALVLKPIMQLYWRAFHPAALAPAAEEVHAMTQRLPPHQRHRLAA